MDKPCCDECIHCEVCGVKKIAEEIEAIAEKSGIYTKHPYFKFEVKCIKFVKRQ